MSRGSQLSEYLNKTVNIVTSDGRNIVGVLKGFDNTINMILTKSTERIYSLEAGVIQKDLGVHIIRGDNVAVIGEVNVSEEEKRDLPNEKANPLKPVVY